MTYQTKKLILDTDLGGDCDDVGAAAVLCSLAKRNKVRLLAATHCIGNPWGAYFLRGELAFLGFPDVPVGRLRDASFMTEPVYERYARPCTEAAGWSTEDDFEDAVRLLRRTLAANGGVPDITLAAIGPLRVIAGLLASGADDISPKTGRELIAENVAEFYTMLGSVSHPDMCEWNVKMDIPSARSCIAEMPVPVVFAPFEEGDHILTGAQLDAVPPSHPVRHAYTVYRNGQDHIRSSWDLITVYAAVCSDTPLYARDPLYVTVRENGCFAVSAFRAERPMYSLRQIADDSTVVSVLDPLMV